MRILPVLGVVMSVLIVCGNAAAMNKAELIDAIAGDSGLSKAVVQGTLDGFINSTTRALKQGNRVALVGFGSFSISRRGASTDGCASEAEVDFYAASPFRFSEGAQQVPFQMVIRDGAADADGSLWVYGPNNGAWVRSGDTVSLASRVEVRGWDWVNKRPGKGRTKPANGEAVRGKVVGVLVNAADGTGETVADEGGADTVGLLLRGIEKSDIRRGMGLAGERRPDPVPTGDCPDGGFSGHIVTEGELLAEIAKESRLPTAMVTAAYDALLNGIIDVVNSGEEVDLGDFGRFFEEHELAVSAHEAAHVAQQRARTGRNPQTGKEIQIAAKGLNRNELRLLFETAKQIARRGRNPQTGKEIQIKAKKVAKFKAGAALASAVN